MNFKRFLFSFIFSFVFAIPVYANKNYKLINEVLFESQNLSQNHVVTLYDYQNFKSVYNESLLNLKKNLFKSSEEEFFFIYLISAEADDLNIDPDMLLLKKLNQKTSSMKLNKIKLQELDFWVQKIALASQQLNLKVSQHETRTAVQTWADTLIRKFNIQFKSDEFKNKLQFK